MDPSVLVGPVSMMAVGHIDDGGSGGVVSRDGGTWCSLRFEMLVWKKKRSGADR